MADKKMSNLHTLQATMGHIYDEPQRWLPTFQLNEKDLPAIKNWVVGRKYRLELEVEQISVRKDEPMRDKPQLEATFRILKVKDVPDSDEVQIKSKKVQGRIEILKVIPYRGSMVYIRRIDKDIFMYDLVFKKEIYSSYMVITPKKGQTELSEKEVAECRELIYAGACATVDIKRGDIKLDQKTNDMVKTFESNRKAFEGRAVVN